MSDRKEYLRNWYILNKERIKEKGKGYYENNKEKILERGKNYLQSDKGKKKRNEWNTSPAGRKSKRINNWKRQGIICDDFNALYEIYLNTKFCDLCKVEFIEGSRGLNKRCLDHDHDTGLVRNILCNNCNANIVR